MLINLWRYSHFALAVSSSIFLFLAAVTGVILAFEPIQTQLQPYKVSGSGDLSLAAVVDTLLPQYDEILELEVGDNLFVKASVISMDENLDGDFYINPFNGAKIADIPEKSAFFQWVTNFHRSLFLKTIGRIFVGIASFLLFLIAITGCVLILRRQGWVKFFSKIIRERTLPYYHTYLGRLSFLPIFVIALSGVYLSLWRFTIIPNEANAITYNNPELTTTPALPLAEFEIFQQTKLRDVQKLEFPFSKDVEDFFILHLKNKLHKINQKTGDIVETQEVPLVHQLWALSFQLHTGSGSMLWSIVLAIASVNILFFMYSGGLISYRRIKSKISNQISAEEAEMVILVGSENGGTRSFANVLLKALRKQGQKVYLDDLNHYRSYPKMQQLVIMTCTYGDGEAPANASNFLALFDRHPIQQQINYAVVGFGSLSFPKFCQFALEVNNHLQQQAHCHALDEPFLIHKRSYSRFKLWAEQWSKQVGITLKLPISLSDQKEKLETFKVIDKKIQQDTFTLTLEAKKLRQFQSGDLLAIYPPDDEVARLYSIGQNQDGHILLSIKRHKFGACSNYLFRLEIGAELNALLQENKRFHFPDKASAVTLIANGTGIAPFLGMVQQKRPHTKVQLFWGGRTQESFELYKSIIHQAKSIGALEAYYLAFSREDPSYRYVQDLLKEREGALAAALANGEMIMICGSIAMQNEVLALLERSTLRVNQKPLSYYHKNKQILMDCY